MNTAPIRLTAAVRPAGPGARAQMPRWIYAALSAFLAGDAIASAIPIPYVANQMDTMGVPPRFRPVIPVAKAVASLGLGSVFRAPLAARVTTGLLGLYFAGALAIHARVRNRSLKVIPPVVLLVIFTVMTVRGPAVVRRTPDRPAV